LHLEESKYDEQKLLTLLKEDSEYAFQLIYDCNRNRIYKTAVWYLKSPILAQEVVQDVFLKLWFERNEFKINTSIEGWLYIVAKNNILNRLKKISNEWKALNVLPLLKTDVSNNTENAILDSEYSSILNAAVQSLPTQQRRVFQLARQEQLSYSEIGKEMDLSPLTVKTHMSRALTHIKAYLKLKGIIISLFSMIFIGNPLMGSIKFGIMNCVNGMI
jgi:RNA polymerase sigma-70 factor (ECF subfamily)